MSTIKGPLIRLMMTVAHIKPGYLISQHTHEQRFFWWLNPARLYPLYKILYPKRRIESYSILGTIISQIEYYLHCVADSYDFRRFVKNRRVPDA